MFDIKSLQTLMIFAVIGVVASACSSTAQLAKSPEEIPDTPAELLFNGLEVRASDDASALLAITTPRLFITAAPNASCEHVGGDLAKDGEITLSVDLPSDAEAGDVYELPSDAPPGTGPGASIGIVGNHSFSFGHGLIVVDERTDEVVKVRIDLASPDGTKKARGAVTAPFCPDK